MDADVVVVEDRRVEHLVVARRVRRDDRVLLADGDALLQRGVDLLDRDRDRVGHAERLGVGQELRRVREPDRDAGEVVGAVDLDVLRGEGAGAEEPAVDDVDAGRLMEGAEQVFRSLVDPLEGVLDIVERVGRVHDADGLERRAQRGGALQVDVDVAGLDEREPVRVGTELARRVQLDGEADVGFLESLLEQFDAAVVVRRLLVLAGCDGERDGFARRGGFGGGALRGAAAAGAAGDDKRGCCEHRRGDSASARRSGCAHVTLLLCAHVFVLAGRDIRWPQRDIRPTRLRTGRDRHRPRCQVTAWWQC